ncbi:5-methyltetrahydropteroyltriglutamate--homocysteine S-methyltransferase [Thalassolituus marinus]|uniref:5-methyltetrahydropteroyltriglutamate--homocysteine methyltransferase n=1 Tax=Thalassolituus marinus TaxID=671053 RepID=A0ABS7ZUF6_9GAMM|nr:5-methyltetrahydropteroyltriglutamate--homocysteine S-methyltransferase [Thalassolituus marinus]MCA6065301.1 5-methyltetrahydropteroyltriglutamate--homocysteine S-methyltransferase [Thalassolituus marinus]
MSYFHILGFPRIGAQRQLKWALESYWRGDSSLDELLDTAAQVRVDNWQQQIDHGADLLTVGDFALYDHMLNASYLFGHLPQRVDSSLPVYDQLFLAGRGRSQCGCGVAAGEMTKWFDTNYHYLVPECSAADEFHLQPELLLEEVRAARKTGKRLKVVLPGPLTYLYLGRSVDGSDRLDLLPRLLPLYSELFEQLSQEGVDWVQLDEPVLALDLPEAWRFAFEPAYFALRKSGLSVLLATYFGDLNENLSLAFSLPVDGVHLDLVSGAGQLSRALDLLGPYKVLSLGVVDGRNIWRSDLDACLAVLKPLAQQLDQRLWLAPSCSLLHVPVDASTEPVLTDGVQQWLAFAIQKLDECALLRNALADGEVVASARWREQAALIQHRRQSTAVNRQQAKQRATEAAAVTWGRNTPYRERLKLQQEVLRLPLLPTTTIGSFPQTQEIRTLRRDYRNGRVTPEEYGAGLASEIARCIRVQEQIGLDVLVHGEAERNDMVEYFGEQLQGIASTANGWVQSYGSRCVKPPVIYGDIERPNSMTVAWSRYAQSLTERPVKGMLTGPVTILKWSFVRDDQPWSATAYQLAAVLRDEVSELEASGISVIQVDEPALREALPLRRAEHQAYLNWAVNSFRYCVSGVADSTQIHTHMCYADFDDILPAIEAMDADVITLETARSASGLLKTLAQTPYANGIGPGVYDIHSPNVPSAEAMEDILLRSLALVRAEDLWVNPDCGLKTRRWEEVVPALEAMVAVAARCREVVLEKAS